MSRSAPAVVVAAAFLHADLLGDRDLHVVDVAPVPDRLEDAVGESEDQDVLHRLLAEVVIDPVDLVLIEHLPDLALSARADARSCRTASRSPCRRKRAAPAASSPAGRPSAADNRAKKSGAVAR